MWKSSGDDGTVKLFLYNANGNQAFAISSTGDDLSGATQADGVTYANALLAGFVPGKAGTLTLYDRRNQATQTRSLYLQRSATSTASTVFSRSYNAFGEVASETAPITDANGDLALTSYSYNTMGKLIRTTATPRHAPTTRRAWPCWQIFDAASAHLPIGKRITWDIVMHRNNVRTSDGYKLSN
ncbi:hypothetical protein [Flavisphingomonas formosensis]|uniref:hypothetical protein n=1 Tax=Flavisphingomonas formosensis TaxID=861534 RepID=UPI0012F911B8|nr:hypothetical protein [Sphingomonas formosensis]